jgi:SAM-dependent methyltransferase
MFWRRILFDTLFRLGRPIWDTPVPHEIHAIAEGPGALPPGTVLDLGCGTSGNVAYLARHGWDATGVDFSGAAIKKAQRDAGGLAGATFIRGDVTKLTRQGITGPFDLVIDNGCYHSLPDAEKSAYVREVAAVTKRGAPLLMWEGIRLKPDEIPQRFSTDFVVERITEKDFVGKRFGRQFTIDAHWYQLRRKPPT